MKRRNLIKGIRSKRSRDPRLEVAPPADKAMFKRLVELTRLHRGARQPTYVPPVSLPKVPFDGGIRAMMQ
ncbi:MAG: hypothetical protein J2P48_20170 [Alphaproteobacteria bacterium]|nr:hypothetical protein [Alphaproteobacteria bacterium]